MVLRYITGSGTNRKKQTSVQQQANALLRNVVSVIDLNDHDNDYDELFKTLKKYTSDVICSCHDHMGNTILHILFSRRASCNINDNETSIIVDNDRSTSKMNQRTSRRRGRSLKGNDSNNPKATLLQVVHYLTNCSDTTSFPDGANDEAIMGSDVYGINCGNNTFSTPLIRQKSAGGSLPLHMACRFRYSSDQQQIDMIQYLIDAYPYAVQCPDMWGNLPLHEACDINSSKVLPPIEIIILLIQIYPESIRIPNTDGNLPLHLVASVTKKTLSVLMNMDGSSAPVNDSEKLDFDEDDPMKYMPSNETEAKNMSPFELRQFEIVEYVVGYWPESVHITNNMQQTALQQAVVADTNASMIEFLQCMSKKIDPPSSSLPPATDCDNFKSKQAMIKSINPFDDDCESLNTTMSVSILSDDIVPDVQFPSNIIDMNAVNGDNDKDDESETDFDGVVELAEDYFEVVVVDRTIDHDNNNDDQTYCNRPEMFESMGGQVDLVFNNDTWASHDNNSNDFESIERFMSPFK